MRVLVTGGRNFRDVNRIYVTLDAIHKENEITLLIAGGAKGADGIATEWALSRGVATDIYAADWATYGKAAGPIRNQKMLDVGQPDRVVAFPGGRGTQDMIKRARRAALSLMILFPLPEPRFEE